LNIIKTKEFLLEHQWTLYQWPGNDWQSIKEIMTIRTIQDFWRWTNNLTVPSQMVGINYAFFCDQIPPIWESPANTNGGKWTWWYSGSQRTILDHDWMHLLLLLIGSTLELEEKIVGVTIHIRSNGDRMSLWLKSSSEEEIKKIGQQIQTELRKSPRFAIPLKPPNPSIRFPPESAAKVIQYKFHSDSANSKSSYEAKSSLQLKI
jgi:hypothetical protein